MFESILRGINKEISKTNVNARMTKKFIANDKCNEFLDKLERDMFDKWYKESGETGDRKMVYRIWRNLLTRLYHCRAINKQELYNQINYTNGIDTSVYKAFEYDRMKNKGVGNY